MPSNFICTYSHYTATKYANALFVVTFKFRLYSPSLLHTSEPRPLSLPYQYNLSPCLQNSYLKQHLLSIFYWLPSDLLPKIPVVVVPPSSLINHKDHPNALWIQSQILSFGNCLFSNLMKSFPQIQIIHFIQSVGITVPQEYTLSFFNSQTSVFFSSLMKNYLTSPSL